MAAYHFSAKIVSRGAGKSAVAAAAYRAGERLVDERTGAVFDYTSKSDVIESATLTPASTPDWASRRAELWNQVEAREKRRDAQLAQEFEINLPRELSDAENWKLLTDFARAELIGKGRVCDISFHKHIAADGLAHPHGHILLPLRVLTSDGFGGKHPDVDRKTFFQNKHRIEQLRETWCAFARERAAQLGYDLGPDWDHRSLDARELNIEPQPKIGATAVRLQEQGHAPDRIDEYQRALARNGERLLADPMIALQAMTAQASTFTERDLARWVHRHATEAQFPRILQAARAGALEVGRDTKGQVRLSTPAMIDCERRMLADAQVLAFAHAHAVDPRRLGRTLSHSKLSAEQQDAARHLIEGGDLTAMVGLAGTGKSTMLADVRAILEAQGYRVRGGALSGIAAESLQKGSGIEARTLDSLAASWRRGRDLLTNNDVLVIDEAGMIGSRQTAAVLARAREAGAKVIMVGDPSQLQAIEAGAAFRAIIERTGAASLTTIRRQAEPWQCEATRELAAGQAPAALARYAGAGMVRAAKTLEEARAAIVAQWADDRLQAPEQSRIILAYRRDDVAAINAAARATLRAEGQLGDDVALQTVNGRRAFAAGDRFLFLRNDRDLAVKNGTLGQVVSVTGRFVVVRTDDGHRVEVDPGAYDAFDHGYASTVHKAQGVTVDRSYVLATRRFDRHLAYVALSRHRDRTEVFYGQDDIADARVLARTCSRDAAKDTSLDYAEELADLRGLARAQATAGERSQQEARDKRHARVVSHAQRTRERGKTFPERTLGV